MLWLLVLLVVVTVGYFVWKNNKTDKTVQKVTSVVEKMADVNKDGKVDLQDVVAAAENIKKEVEKDVAIVKQEIVKDVAAAKKTAAKVRKKYNSKIKKNSPKA